MSTLDLYKDRTPHIVILDVNGEKKEFKIPTSYTVEEVERLLEIQSRIDDLVNQEKKEGEESKQISAFFEALFEQLLVLFSRYQSEMSLDFLKKHLTREDAQKIIAFHTQEQLLNSYEQKNNEPKKKTQDKS